MAFLMGCIYMLEQNRFMSTIKLWTFSYWWNCEALFWSGQARHLL